MFHGYINIKLHVCACSDVHLAGRIALPVQQPDAYPRRPRPPRKKPPDFLLRLDHPTSQLDTMYVLLYTYTSMYARIFPYFTGLLSSQYRLAQCVYFNKSNHTRTFCFSLIQTERRINLTKEHLQLPKSCQNYITHIKSNRVTTSPPASNSLRICIPLAAL